MTTGTTGQPPHEEAAPQEPIWQEDAHPAKRSTVSHNLRLREGEIALISGLRNGGGSCMCRKELTAEDFVSSFQSPCRASDEAIRSSGNPTYFNVCHDED